MLEFIKTRQGDPRMRIIHDTSHFYDGQIFYITFIPALFMTAVCTTYICVAPEGFGLSAGWSPYIGLGALVVATIWFRVWYSKESK